MRKEKVLFLLLLLLLKKHLSQFAALFALQRLEPSVKMGFIISSMFFQVSVESWPAFPCLLLCNGEYFGSNFNLICWPQNSTFFITSANSKLSRKKKNDESYNSFQAISDRITVSSFQQNAVTNDWFFILTSPEIGFLDYAWFIEFEFVFNLLMIYFRTIEASLLEPRNFRLSERYLLVTYPWGF